MNCIEAQEKVIDFVLGELSHEEAILLKEHMDQCPTCNGDFKLLSQCLQVCIEEDSETCVCQFQESYWEEFIVSVHDKISHEKIEKRFPFHVVIPVAASILIAMALGYYIFLRPKPEETVEETTPNYEAYDPFQEVDELSPEEAEEFIKIINQRYGGE
jgi:hypothetical protein